MPFREKGECFSAEANGLMEVLHHLNSLVPNGEISRKVVQRARSQRMPLRAKGEYFSAENNGLIEVLYFPKLLAPSGKIKGKVVQ